ncbi:MAG: hypothetical protein ACKVRN_15600 [Pyrinomonadaceae bacterium]
MHQYFDQRLRHNFSSSRQRRPILKPYGEAVIGVTIGKSNNSFPSPTATNIKAYGAVSKANETIGSMAPFSPSLKATHIRRRYLFVAFSDGMVVSHFLWLHSLCSFHHRL